MRTQGQITLNSVVHNINNNLINARTNNISFLVHNINIQVIGHIFSHIFKFNTEGMHPLCGALFIYQTLGQKDNFLMSNCSFGDNLFLSRLLQNCQKPSLIGKGFSRNVTPYIICSSHIDWLKKTVARWLQKRADIFASLP